MLDPEFLVQFYVVDLLDLEECNSEPGHGWTIHLVGCDWGFGGSDTRRVDD